MKFKSDLNAAGVVIRDAWLWVKEIRPIHWVAERLHGRYTETPREDWPPTVKGKDKAFENRWWSPLDWFIRIPSQLTFYEWWEINLSRQHLLLKPSPPDGAVSHDICGINMGLLREQYKMQIRLYERYLDLLIRFNFLNFAITGAALSFSLQYIKLDIIRWSFTVPCVMNFFFAILLLLAFRSLKVINREVIYMSAFLGFQPPGIRTLRHALLCSFTVLMIMASVLLPTTVNDHLYPFGHLNVNERMKAAPSPTPDARSAPPPETSPSPAPSSSPSLSPSPSPSPSSTPAPSPEAKAGAWSLASPLVNPRADATMA
ncbi:MAG TPA: hypothetical protein VEY11_18850 [Pyrinomonadaceae bacterium]|nr:hypothetical protein [Pyrinomonadaceae bacterium]